MANFKIQINEVTSRLQHGWIFLVVKAEQMQIKPFIVEKLIVLAKERTVQKWKNLR